MAITSEIVTVGTSATALNPVSTAGQTLHITNGATGIDLGDSTVTSAAGFAVAASGALTVEVDAGGQLFAIVGTGTSDVQVLRT